MKKLFDMDNPVMKALSVAADLIVLNLMTLLCSIPVVTAGAAITAMNDIVIRIVREEESYILKPFFRSFASNLKKGALMSLIILSAAAVFGVDYYAAKTYMPVMRAAVVAGVILFLAIALYAFALLARYENTLGKTLKNAVLLSITHFPRTLVMVLFTVGMWFVCIRYYSFGAAFLFLFGLSLPCYISILMINKVFNKLDDDDRIE